MMTQKIWSEQEVANFTPEQRRIALELIEAAGGIPIWSPLPGPQTMAYESMADIVGFGGAAGGGKTDLGLGKALTKHRKTAILRREATQLTGIIDRMTDIIGSRDGFNGQDKIWRNAGPKNVQVELGSTPHAGDEEKYQGRPKDLLVIEEAAHFLESQVRFLMGWVRTTVQGQHCQTLMTFNPPTNAEGRWIITFFAPWLDPKFPNPAQPGELRYAASLKDSQNNSYDLWVDDGRSFVLVDGKPCYEFNPDDYQPQDIIRPLSRTFIPSKVSDNPYLVGTGYMATLQSLPEPLRSQMLYGDFQAGIEDDPWQVIPTSWVEHAQKRWIDYHKKPEMDSLGIDVARGGKDKTVIARRHGMWFDVPLIYKGEATPNGPKVAGLTIAASRDNAVQHIDVIGVGASPYDFLNNAKQPVVGVNVAESATGTDKSGKLNFYNLRSQLWWYMREALDPNNNTGIMLPPNKELLADLCAPIWELRGKNIFVESREDIVKRIKRSPDIGTAYILALINTPKMSKVHGVHSSGNTSYNPYNNPEYNPYGDV